MQDEGVGPVVAVVDDAASGDATDEGGDRGGFAVSFEGGLDVAVALSVAEGGGGLEPGIVTEEGQAWGDGFEQGSVDRHIGGGVAQGVGQLDQHGRGWLRVRR